MLVHHLGQKCLIAHYLRPNPLKTCISVTYMRPFLKAILPTHLVFSAFFYILIFEVTFLPVYFLFK